MAYVLCGHIEQGLHRGNRSGKLSNLFLVHWEHVAISGSSLCIDERDAAGETLLILAAEREAMWRMCVYCLMLVPILVR